MAKNRKPKQTLGKTKNYTNQDFNIVAVLVSIVLFVAPFNRALYFDKEFFFAAIFLTLVFGGWAISRKVADKPLLTADPIGIAGWGLLAAYLAACLVAVNLRGAIGEVVRIGTYLLTYYLVANNANDTRTQDYYLKALYAAGVLVALAGLGTAFGTFNFAGAFEKASGRILSTLQYANSLAVYLNVMLFIGLYLCSTTKQKHLPILYTAGNFIIFLTFLGTQSRGAWLVFLPVCAAFLWGQPKGIRLKAFLNLLAAVIASFAVAKGVLSFSPPKAGTVYWLWLLLGALISAGLAYVIMWVWRLISEDQTGQTAKEAQTASEQKRILRMVGIFLGVCVLVFAAAAVVKPEILPKTLVSRIANINFNEQNVQERLVFYKDAFKVIKDYPILGTGGKGWGALYQKYQSYQYFSNQVHNHFLQTWVEAGTVGLALYLAVWAAFLVIFFRSWRLAESFADKSRTVTIGITTVAIGLHSLIDFNLSLGSISLVFWTLLGLTQAGYQRLNQGRLSKEKVVKLRSPWGLAVTAGAVGLAVLLFGTALDLSVAISHGEAAVQALRSKDGLGAQKEFEAAISYDPFESGYPADLGNLLLTVGSQQKNQEFIRQGISYAQKAVGLSPESAKIRVVLARGYMLAQNIPAGIQELETAVTLNPWGQSGYDNLSTVYLQAGSYYLAKGDSAKAKDCFLKSSKIPDRVNRQLAKLTAQYKKMWIRKSLLKVTPEMEKNKQQSEANLAKLAP